MLPFTSFFKPIVLLTNLIGLPDCWRLQSTDTVTPNRLVSGFHLVRGLFIMVLALGVVGHIYWGLFSHTNDAGSKKGIVDIFIDSTIWCTTTYPAVITHFFFAFKTRSIRSFFATWDRLLINRRISCTRSPQRLLQLILLLYAVMAISSCVSIVVYVVFGPSPGLLTYEPHFATGYSHFLAVLLHTFHVVYSWVFTILGEVGVGALCYYLSLSFSNVNENLNSRYKVLPLLRMDPTVNSMWATSHVLFSSLPSVAGGQDISSQEISLARKRTLAIIIPESTGRVENIRTAWQSTESTVRLASELNESFGLVILVTHAAQFLMTCVLGYTVLRRQSIGGAIYVSYLMNFIFCVLKTICFSWLCSSIHNEYEKLQLTVSGLASLYGIDETLHFFMNRLHGRSLCLSPYGLYTINNSALLAIFSALITYLIVLLQSASS